MGQYSLTHTFGKTFFENGKVRVYAYPKPHSRKQRKYNKKVKKRMNKGKNIGWGW